MSCSSVIVVVVTTSECSARGYGGMTLLQTIAGDFVNKITQEIKRPENKDLVRVHLLDPVIEYTFGRLYPYIIVTSIIFFLTFVIATVVLIVVLRR